MKTHQTSPEILSSEQCPKGRSALMDTAVDVLALAFRDNPINVAVIGGGPRHRLRSNVHGMRTTLRAAALGQALLLVARTDGESPPAGALLALPPGGQPLPRAPLWVQLRCVAGQGFRVVHRWSQVHDALAIVQPLEPHWYLSVVGVDPARQGQGLGAALLRAWLRQVDADAMPGHLETDRADKVAFYQRFGFEVSSELRVLGVPVWCMRREARRAAAS